MARKFLLVLASTMLLTACQTESVNQEASSLEGSWLRPINGAPGEFEGMTFGADGSFGLLNIYSMSGSSWEQNGDQVVITTLTERYPEPDPSTVSIEKLTAEQLILSGDSFFAGSYKRDDDAGGMVAGSLSMPTGTVLPKDALLTIQLEDVSLADAPSKLVGNRLIPVGGQSGSIDWEVYYPGAVIDTRNTYNISAVIAYDNSMQLRTTSHFGVFTDGMSKKMDIEVVDVSSKAADSGKPMQGMYNYMADAGMFYNCADQQNYPVAMEGANIDLERAYTELRQVDNEKIWIEVVGELVERADMEGGGSSMSLLVNKFVSINRENACPVASNLITGTKWLLIEVSERSLVLKDNQGDSLAWFEMAE